MGPAVVAVAILALVLLVAWGKVHPFLAFILVSAGAALALGMPPADVAGALIDSVKVSAMILMLLIAGLLEGFGRQLITDTMLRYAVGSLMLLLWLAYYYIPRRGDAASQGVCSRPWSRAARSWASAR